MALATLYRVIDTYPFREREDYSENLTLEEAASLIEDLYPIRADEVIADVEDGVEWPVVYVDEETGRRIVFMQEVPS